MYQKTGQQKILLNKAILPCIKKQDIEPCIKKQDIAKTENPCIKLQDIIK